MQDHAIGPLVGVRQGSDVIEHSYPIEFNDATAVAKTLGTIKASLTEPVIVEGFIIVQTPSDAVTSHVIVGTIGGTAFIPSTSIKTAAGTKTAASASLILTANSDIVVTPTIVGGVTVGRTWVIIQARGLNVSKTQK